MILIRNGLVKTMAGPDIENGQVLVDGGKIVDVGAKVQAPPNAQMIDASGCIVAPGFVEAHCHIGLFDSGIAANAMFTNEIADARAAHLRGIDGLQPMDEMFYDAYSHGVTTAVTGPGGVNVLGGTFAAVKLWGRRIDDMILKNPVAMKCAFGENPKAFHGQSRKEAPMTRMGTAAMLRETLAKAVEYGEGVRAHEADPNQHKKPPFDAKLEAMLPVIRREIPLKAHVHRADDIFTALRVAREFDVDITLDHCTDGHLIADELAKEGVPCLVGCAFGEKLKPEHKNQSWVTPGVLDRAGVKVAIITDAPGPPLEYLPLCAGLAIGGGMAEEAAWRAITINPAEIIGIADRVGSLEIGKDADIAIHHGNPLTSLWSKTLYTLIDGHIVHPLENK